MDAETLLVSWRVGKCSRNVCWGMLWVGSYIGTGRLRDKVMDATGREVGWKVSRFKQLVGYLCGRYNRCVDRQFKKQVLVGRQTHA